MRRGILLFVNAAGLVSLVYLTSLKLNQIDIVPTKNLHLHNEISREFNDSKDIDELHERGTHFLNLLREERLTRSRTAWHESYLYGFLAIVLIMNLWNQKKKN